MEMNAELLTLFGNFVGFGVVVYLLDKSHKAANADREWMKQVLWYLIQQQDPDNVKRSTMPLPPLDPPPASRP